MLRKKLKLKLVQRETNEKKIKINIVLQRVCM